MFTNMILDFMVQLIFKKLQLVKFYSPASILFHILNYSLLYTFIRLLAISRESAPLLFIHVSVPKILHLKEHTLGAQ